MSEAIACASPTSAIWARLRNGDILAFSLRSCQHGEHGNVPPIVFEGWWWTLRQAPERARLDLKGDRRAIAIVLPCLHDHREPVRSAVVSTPAQIAGMEYAWAMASVIQLLDDSRAGARLASHRCLDKQVNL